LGSLDAAWEVVRCWGIKRRVGSRHWVPEVLALILVPRVLVPTFGAEDFGCAGLRRLALGALALGGG
jgi:hypothetical protein